MLIAGRLLARGAGLAPALLRRAATVELDWDTRQKSRFDVVDSSGRTIGVFLPRGVVVRGGDVLVCDDGSLIAVRAAAQAVLAVGARAGGTALDLLRAAYHLGNRHVPLEIGGERLQLEPDHVLEAMLRRMGLAVETVRAPFEPESGAYSAELEHVHDASCGHGDGRTHGHGDAHGHDPRSGDLR